MLLYMPTKVYSEKECVKNRAKELASYGKKSMIITGKHSSRKNGALRGKGVIVPSGCMRSNNLWNWFRGHTLCHFNHT